tara:strand:+ start:9280 stop:9795 length:516 start_codon:yes stop_codon:yes gene_type:complete
MFLGLDLATCTGFCHGPADTGEVPTLGHITMPKTGPDVGRFLCVYEDWLNALVRRIEPALIVFEAPILPSTTKLETTRKLQGLAGVTEMVGHRHRIELAEVAGSTVKKALTGSGKAEKADMIAAARHYGFNPQTSDEADAFGIWLHALRLRHPRAAGFWDPINFQGGVRHA